MPGRTTYLSENPNDFQWTIPEGRARAFEELISRYLRRYVATQDGRVKMVPTRAVGDAGRDFEVYFTGEVELFGLKILQPANRIKGVVFVECKSTERPRLDDGFIVDASQHHDYESCSYVLVTNAVVTPYCQQRAQREWERRNSAFHLVDRRKLADEIYLRQMDDEAKVLGLMLPPLSHLPTFDRSHLVVSCQTESFQSVGKHVANVYVTMTNYSSENVLADLDIATDMRWLSKDSHYERIIPPGFVETVELSAERQEFSGPDELDLTLCMNGRSQRLTVANPAYKLTLEPHFTGENHRRIMQEIRAAAETATGFNFISVQGEAGVGKTRTIKEALDPLRDGKLNFFTYIFSHQGTTSFKDFYDTFDLTDELIATADTAARVSELILLAAKTEAPILIHFEDLHHADEGVLKIFKQMALRSPNCAAPLIVIATGRDDHTFPNEEYYSFLQLVTDQSIDHVFSYVIPPLTNKDAEILIRSVVTNMPDPGIERVLTLGQNNPFIILEVLQYLLDMRLVKLLSRRTMGVLNPEVFAGRDGLPKTVEDLYDQRLDTLKTAIGGELANAFLIAASFFGFIIDPDVRRTFFDGEEAGEDSWNLLRERRFVKEDAISSETTFAHENLLHHARRVARRPENAQESASLILKRPGLAKRLSILDLGEIYYLHKDYAEAFKSFGEVWERIQGVTNFSSEEINKKYFRYLPSLFHAAKAIGEAKAQLSKVALAHGYMGVHNFPLVVAEKACAISKDLLSEIYKGGEEGLREKLAIRQLHAHALQNMGRTSLALKEMLEIEAALSEVNQHWPEVEFDLYDRMQTYYQKINHEEMVRFYSRQAGRSVEESDDAKLRAAHLITQSVISMFSGEQEARRCAADAHEAAKLVRVERFITYTRLTELVVATLYSRQEPAILKPIYEEARVMLRDAAWNNFSDSIMRIELLLATLALNCYEDTRERHDRARFYINSGQANSLRFGNGLFDWAFDNLAAVIDLNERRDDDVRSRFRSCLERLNKRGLTFLGAQSGLYPNTFAISNIVRFFGQFKDSGCIELIRSTFSTYDNCFLEKEHEGIDLVRRAVKGRPVFCPERLKFQMLRYPLPNGYFTPLF